jgi:hypothetical protein
MSHLERVKLVLRGRSRSQYRIAVRFLACLIASVVLIASSQVALSCPNCPAGLTSYADHIASSDAVILTEWSSAVEATDDASGSTTVHVRQIVKGPTKRLSAKNIKLDRYRAGKKGDLYLVFGVIGEETSALVWNDVVEVNAASFQYILKAPAMELESSKRLSYFLNFLEFKDDLVANDAFAEFAGAEYKTLVDMAPQLPREKIRGWILDPETPAIRLGLYGTLLGLCGNRSDARVLETRIVKHEGVGAFPLGLEGVISGYLMIEGAAGLDLIDAKLLQNTETPFTEVFAAAQALRFMWIYSKKISHERLCKSMEGLLVRSEIADIVIADLARWKDWTAMDRVVKLYDQGEKPTLSTRRAVVRFLLICAKQPQGKSQQAEIVAEQINRAQAHLKKLRAADPEIVANAERFFEVP